MPLTTTDLDTVRPLIAAQIERIIPRRAAGRDSRYVYTPDQEICGTLRTFDLVMDEEVEVLDGETGYGEGIRYKSPTRIVVSYPVSTPERRRFIGSDSQDLAALLAKIHTLVDGLFPVGMHSGAPPIFDREITGQDGSYVCAYLCEIHFYASDTVTLE